MPDPQVSDSAGLEQDLEIWVSEKFPCGADAAGLRNPSLDRGLQCPALGLIPPPPPVIVWSTHFDIFKWLKKNQNNSISCHMKTAWDSNFSAHK